MLASLNAGGCAFLADPAARADAQAVFWLPDVLAGTVILSSHGSESSSTIRFAPEAWASNVLLRDAPDGSSYAILRDGRVEHRVWIAERLSIEQPIAAIIPLDENALVRADATSRFWRYVTGRRALMTSAISGQRLSRLASSLRALDGRQTGASYRSIAQALFGPARVAADAWKTASIRDTTIRLVRSGIAMMKSGYRGLLGSRPKD